MHLQTYLEEFTFRFNGRNSRRPGLLFYRLLEGAVMTSPLTHGQLVQTHNHKRPGHPRSPTANPLLVGPPLKATWRP